MSHRRRDRAPTLSGETDSSPVRQIAKVLNHNERDKVKTSESIAKIAPALAKAQSEMKDAKRDGRGYAIVSVR